MFSIPDFGPLKPFFPLSYGICGWLVFKIMCFGLVSVRFGLMRTMIIVCLGILPKVRDITCIAIHLPLYYPYILNSNACTHDASYAKILSIGL